MSKVIEYPGSNHDRPRIEIVKPADMEFERRKFYNIVHGDTIYQNCQVVYHNQNQNTVTFTYSRKTIENNDDLNIQFIWEDVRN